MDKIKEWFYRRRIDILYAIYVPLKAFTNSLKRHIDRVVYKHGKKDWRYW